MSRSKLVSRRAVVGLLVLVVGLGLQSLAGASRASPQGGVIPTNEWVSFYSANTTFAGGPVPVGAYIAAYDPAGVQCGEFTVLEAGTYGLMPVYRDDDTAHDVDEGADPGDRITFTINGRPVMTLWGRMPLSGPVTVTD